MEHTVPQSGPKGAFRLTKPRSRYGRIQMMSLHMSFMD